LKPFFIVATGEAGFKFEEALRNWVLFGVFPRDTDKFDSDCLDRSEGEDCRSLRALATEGDLVGTLGDCDRVGERDLDLDFSGVVGGKRALPVSLFMVSTAGASESEGRGPSIEGLGMSGSMMGSLSSVQE
jgi:hypothetical protein